MDMTTSTQHSISRNVKCPCTQAYNNLGNALAGVGRLQEAATAYATCIQVWASAVKTGSVFAVIGCILYHGILHGP